MRGRALSSVLCAATLLGICPAASFAQAPPQNPTPPAQAVQQDPVAALRKLLTDHPELLDQLRALLDQMAKERAGGQPPARPGEPEIPPIEIPGEKAQPGQPPIPQPGQPA